MFRAPNLFEVKQFGERHRAFPPPRVRWLRYRQEANGFKKAFVKVGGRLLVDEQEFFEAIYRQNGRSIRTESPEPEEIKTSAEAFVDHGAGRTQRPSTIPDSRPLVIDSCPRCGDDAAIVRGPRTTRLYCADCGADEGELVAHNEQPMADGVGT